MSRRPPSCPRGCDGPLSRVESARWGSFWHCGACGHEWDSTLALRGRAGALSKWAATANRTAATSAARTAFLRRFELEVDPQGELEPAERARRAALSRRAYMARLALRSVAIRRAKRAKNAA